MGAEQSSPQDSGKQGQSAAVRKTCYYEVLGIERNATEDEYVEVQGKQSFGAIYADRHRIKKAYRRKALELHPDRNFGNVEAATRQFAEVQSANQVLSDPQERAWYDSHREQILRNEDLDGQESYDHNNRVTTAAELVKLIGKFSPNIPFTDAPNGFFGSLRQTFETLSREEDTACDWEGIEPIDYPDFGEADDDYEDVVKPFYAMWAGFATRKTFSWKDQYNYSEAPDRRVRRLMEKENKRLREDAIREFNDAVRTLVSFVRKRDPRYLPNTQTEADRQKILRDAAAAQAARSRAANQAKIDAQVVPEWAKSAVHDDREGGFSDSELSDEEHYECVTCGKTFKSEKQYVSHEKSKKHIKAVQQLKRQMQKENRKLGLDTSNTDASAFASHSGHEEEDEESEDDIPAVVTEETGDQLASASEAEIQSDLEADDSLKEDFEANEAKESDDADDSGVDDEYASRAEIESRLTGQGNSLSDIGKNKSALDDIITATATTSIASGDDSESVQPKLGKAKAKRAKKAARQEAGSQPGSDFACSRCNEEFPSKTKLFNHIKEEGHAAPISIVSHKKGKGKKK